MKRYSNKQNLKELRQEAGFKTVQAACNETQIKDFTWYAWESNKNPTPKIVEKYLELRIILIKALHLP